tara:strand:- start:8 stop:127 length:120 start_codon:yes stop_codon:yes gene_type:complete
MKFKDKKLIMVDKKLQRSYKVKKMPLKNPIYKASRLGYY